MWSEGDQAALIDPLDPLVAKGPCTGCVMYNGILNICRLVKFRSGFMDHSEIESLEWVIDNNPTMGINESCPKGYRNKVVYTGREYVPPKLNKIILNPKSR